MCVSPFQRLISFLVPVVVCVASTFAHGSDPLPILGGAVAGSYPKAVLASQPVGYWRLEETRGPVAADSSGHKENGQYRGGVTLQLPGAFANDLSAGFDGKTGYVEVPGSTAFSVPTSRKGLSVEVWFNPAALKFRGESKDPYVYWLGKGESAQQEWALRFYSQVSTRPNRISAYVFSRSGGKGAGAFVEEPVHANEWIHIVACFDAGDKNSKGAGVSIYKDGVLRGSPATQHGARYSSFDVVPHAGTAPLRFGTRNFTSYFDGGLDEVAIYPRVLTALEVQEHYRAARPLRTGLPRSDYTD
ncbi:MAG TPA: LamG domain-containing protein [Gemmataceae bacterium]|jgi:hypothetical protein|nr:LamG domain-containing protein [Gemmataceae bacterium]